jgi:hypothetical protein
MLAETHRVYLLLYLLPFLFQLVLRRFFSLLAPALSPQSRDCGVEVGEVLPPRVPPYLRRGMASGSDAASCIATAFKESSSPLFLCTGVKDSCICTEQAQECGGAEATATLPRGGTGETWGGGKRDERIGCCDDANAPARETRSVVANANSGSPRINLAEWHHPAGWRENQK